MINIPTEIAPPALLAAAIAWAGAHYFVVGPNLAERVVRADHLAICETNFRTMIKTAGEDRLASVPLPTLDPAQTQAIAQAKRVLNSPAVNMLREMSGGTEQLFGLDIDGSVREAVRRVEEAQRAAELAYRHSIDRIRAETETVLGAADDVCTCLGGAAIGETRTEWAIFSGSLGIVQPAPLASFAAKMAQLQREGACARTPEHAR